MEWIILFIVSWVLFLLLVKWKELRLNIWGGILAVLYQLFVDTTSISHGLYKINNAVVNLWGSSLLFVFGPVFTVGVLLAQLHPHKRFLRILNVVVLTALYSLQELLLLIRGNVVYTNWSYTSSVFENITVMVALSWFAIVVLNKNKYFGNMSR